MLLRGALVTTVVCALWANVAQAGHVQAELLSDVSTIQPGKPFTLAVRFTIDDGWHIYWKNPGDAGLATRVAFKLPAGFAAGPLQFPTPHRFTQPGDITIFGYEGTVLLLSQITPPASLPPDFQGQFAADASWLVCSADICMPGKASTSLTLSTSASSQPNNQELFADWESQLPVDPANDPDISSADASVSGKACTITIKWTHAAPQDIDLLPDAPDNFTIGAPQISSTQGTTTITFTAEPLTGQHPGPTTLQTVIGYQNNDQKRRGINIPVALPG